MTVQPEKHAFLEECQRETKSQKRTALTRQITAAFIVNIISISNGISAGWTSPAGPILKKANNPLGVEPVSEDILSWASSILYFGGLLGVFVWNKFADRFGRKVTGYVVATTQIVSWLAIILATEPHHLIWARFLMGIGGSGIILNTQLYINEIASADFKIAFCTLSVVAGNFGILLVNVIGFLCSYQVTSYVCVTVPIVHVILFYWLPETPFFLVASNRAAEGRESLKWFRGDSITVIDTEMTEIRNGLHEHQKKMPYSELISTKMNLKITLITIIIFMGQQLSGMAFILCYAVQLFQNTKTSLSPNVSSILVFLLMVIVSGFSTCVVNSIGKKCLLYGAFLGAFFSYASLYCFFETRLYFDSVLFAWIPTVSVTAYIICYSVGVGPVPYLLCIDMFPTRSLNNGLSVGLIIGIATAFLTVKFLPSSPEAGKMMALTSTGLNLFFGLFVKLCVREPKVKQIAANVPKA